MKHAEPVMGTVFSFEIRDTESASMLTPVLARLHEIDETYSTYRADSVISRLNRRELGYDALPDEVRQVLTACQAWHGRTGGWFDIHRADQLDPSGYVKGWAIDEASRMLVAAGSRWHSVNGGGDLLAIAPRGEKPWRFGIVDPLDGSQLRGLVTGHRVALATSGIAERGCHIYEPATGQPPDTRLLSLSVSGRDIIECDVLATAGFAHGDTGPEWLSRFGQLQVLPCYSEEKSASA